MVYEFKHIDKKILIFFFSLFFMNAYTQFYNKDIKAEILIEKTSEFYTFSATAENTTLSDHSLRYEFTVYQTDANGNTSSSSQGNRFYINAGQKQRLSVLTVNYSVDSKVILLLMIYDLEDHPVGKDRIILNNEKEEEDNLDKKFEKQQAFSKAYNPGPDQAAPQDGFVMPGLIVENTMTKAGRDFYRYFYSEYYNLGIQTSVNITIDEVPGRMRSTRISVKVGDALVWQFLAQPRKAFLQQMASTALSRSIYHLQQLQQRREEFIRY